MCGGNTKTPLDDPCECPDCGAPLMANSCIYYPRYCPACDSAFEYDPCDGWEDDDA